MKRMLLVFAVCASMASAAQAADVKTYQVTGPVLDLTPTTITVKKGSDNWQIAVGSAQLPAGVKVGSKVTIQYTMTATSIAAKTK